MNTDTTSSVVTRAELDAFCAILKAASDAHYARNYPNLTPPHFEAGKGRKYSRIIQREDHYPVGSGSAVCFVEMATGDIYYPAGWKGPQKNFRRGNVRDGADNPWITPTGSIATAR